MMTCIGVIGGNQAANKILQLAEEVGKEIALRKAVLVCGGRAGVMEAACRGAKKAGGWTIGILPGENRAQANPYVDIPIVTGMGPGRNIIVVRCSQVVIAINGKYGTLSEISHALQLDIPIIGLQTWDVSDKIYMASTAKEAVDKAFSFIIMNE